MNEFFDNGGTTSFIDKVAGSLGIHASTIKVVGVYTGSVVVDYAIEPDKSSGQTAADLVAIKDKQTKQFATGNMSLGAPLLDVKVKMIKNTTAAPSNSSSNSSSSSTTEEEEEEESIISGGVVDQSTGFDAIILTRTPAAAIIKFTNHFENSLDMRSGEAKTCMSSSDECRVSGSGMCCADVKVTDTEDNTKQNIFRCMNQVAVDYNYGITIDGGYKVEMNCLAFTSYAKYLTLTFASLASLFAMIAI